MENITYILPYRKIGFVASKKRKLKDITPYLKYFEKAKHRDKFFDGKRPKNTYQVLDLIASMVRECDYQTEAFAKAVIDQGNISDTCKKLYYWLYEHIQYHEDEPDIEQLSEPNRAIENALKGIDCDCYSIFISCVLSNLKIPHTLRVVELKHKGYYQHIYVIVPLKKNANTKPYTFPSQHITIDPVMDEYNKEPDRITNYYDYTMLPVQRLDGLGDSQPGQIDRQYNMLQLMHSDLMADPVKWKEMGYSVSNTLQAIEYLLQYWYTPNRDTAIDIVRRQLGQLNFIYSLSGLNDLVASATSGQPFNLSQIINTTNSGSQTSSQGGYILNTAANVATGNYAAAISNAASFVRSLFNSKDNRPGEREKDGWGKKQPNIPVTFKLWGDTWEFTTEWNDDRLSKGYWIKRNGVKWDVAKYIWVENGRLFKQNYLAPWENTWTSGSIISWGQNHRPGGVQDFKEYGQGSEPQPKHLTGLDLTVVDGQPIADWNKSQEGTLQKNEKDNTLIYLGVGALTLVVLGKIYFDWKKQQHKTA